jgi:hypothetical protein
VLAVGNASINKTSTVYWTLTAATGSGVTGVSKVFTVTAETLD